MRSFILIPGLGTDRRIFEQIIPLLNCKEVQCLEYQDPPNLDCTIKEYAQQLLSSIHISDKQPILLGMSMGGTVATELSFLMPQAKLVLISTFKHRSECPLLFKIARIFPIYRLVPAVFIRAYVPLFARLLGICNKLQAHQLKSMLRARTAVHFAWGRRAVVHWDNPKMPPNCLHINGTKDHIFRKANQFATYLIQGGTHNMVVDRAQEIADIINREI